LLTLVSEMKPVSLAILLMVCLHGFAQKAHLGPVIEQREEEETWFGGASDEGVCLVTEKAVSTEDSDVFLELFSPNQKPIGVFEIGKDMAGLLKVADAYVLGKKVYLFVIRQSVDDGSFELHLFKYDFSGLPVGRPQLLFDYPCGKLTLGAFSASIAVQLNTDSTQILVQFPKNQPKTDANRVYMLHLMGLDGYVSWSDSLVVRQEANPDYQVKPTLVDAHGNVYVTAARFPDPNQKSRVVRTLYHYDAESVRWTQQDLNLGELSKVPVLFTFNASGNLAFAGNFSEGGSHTTQHVLYWELSPTDLSVVREHYSTLDSLFPANVNVKSLTPFLLDQFVPLPDSGYLLLAEQHSSRVTNNLTGERANTVIWSTVVGKRQTASGPQSGMVGFLSMLEGNRLHFVFNDPPGNVATVGYNASGRTMHGPTDSGIAVVTIDLSQHALAKKMVVEPGEETQLALMRKAGVSEDGDLIPAA
jgi:hypothetical protein